MEEYLILNQLSSLLKNAEKCPSLLKTIKITHTLSSQSIKDLIDNIEQSLSLVHERMTNQTQVSSDCPVTES